MISRAQKDTTLRSISEKYDEISNAITRLDDPSKIKNGNDELNFLIELYKAISLSNEETIDLNSLGVSDAIVAKNYFYNTSIGNLHQFLWENGLAYGYLHAFGTLSEMINTMPATDSRKSAAQEVYSQAGMAMQSKWLFQAKHQQLLLANLDATIKLLRSPSASNLETYRQLAQNTISTGKWRLFGCAMLTLGITILLAGVGLMLLPLLLPTMTTALIIAGAIGAALVGTGVATSASLATSYGNLFATANRTRVLGNDMVELAKKCER